MAEDDTTDAFLLERTFARTGNRTSLHFVRDGQEAVDYLSGEGTFADREQHPIPALLLSDLKMPRLDGFQVLGWLRRQPGFKRLPVVILSSSSEPGDVNRAYDLGVNSFITKPVTFESLVEVMKTIGRYWFEIVELPTEKLEDRHAQESSESASR